MAYAGYFIVTQDWINRMQIITHQIKLNKLFYCYTRLVERIMQVVSLLLTKVSFVSFVGEWIMAFSATVWNCKYPWNYIVIGSS